MCTLYLFRFRSSCLYLVLHTPSSTLPLFPSQTQPNRQASQSSHPHPTLVFQVGLVWVSFSVVLFLSLLQRAPGHENNARVQMPEGSVRDEVAHYLDYLKDKTTRIAMARGEVDQKDDGLEQTSTNDCGTSIEDALKTCAMLPSDIVF